MPAAAPAAHALPRRLRARRRGARDGLRAAAEHQRSRHQQRAVSALSRPIIRSSSSMRRGHAARTAKPLRTAVVVAAVIIGASTRRNGAQRRRRDPVGADARRASGLPSTAMFQRTKLAEGPRVISARLPGARSVSIAAYVLAGSRLESADQAGVAHFMEHLTFKGTAGYPSRRAICEAVEGVGGSANAATDRESTVYWARVPRREAGDRDGRAGRADRPSHARRCRHRPGADGHRGGDPLLPRRPVRVRPDADPAGALRRGAPGARDLRRRGRHPRPAHRRHPRLLVVDVPARRTRSSPSPATSTTRRRSRSRPRRSGPGTARCPASSRRPSCPPDRAS